MKGIAVLLFFTLILRCSAGIWTNCEIDGITEADFLMGSYSIKENIKDTHKGEVATFKTKTVRSIKVEEGEYLDAKFEDKTLTIFTTDAFKNFEKEVKDKSDKRLAIKINFFCSSSEYGNSLTIYQKVEDINNHAPVLSQEKYKYDLETNIPENFDLGILLPISATDDDFTNKNIYFEIERNEYFKLGYSGKYNMEGATYSTTLKALKNIEAPFRREFTLTATDGGDPAQSTSAKLTINVDSYHNIENENENENEDAIRPPVFSEHLYFGKYTSDEKLKVKPPIELKVGARPDTVIKQEGYNDYIKIESDPKHKRTLHVELLKVLPKSIAKEDFIVIYVTAENPGLTIPGRTALIIRLESLKHDHENHDSKENKENSDECDVQVWGLSYNGTVLPIVASLSGIGIIVVMNVLVLFLCFRKQKHNLVQPVQPTSVTSHCNLKTFKY